MFENEFAQILILAVVQGVAEFLPISSSGHLAVLGWLFGIEEPARVAIVLHAGTLLSILVVYARELRGLLQRRDWHLAALVVVGSVPAAVVGVGLKFSGLVDAVFELPAVSGVGLLLSALVLFSTRWRPAAGGAEGGNRDPRGATIEPLDSKGMTFTNALLVGAAQAVAVCPGVSRAGSTIAAAMRLGMKPGDAATFSFLLAIPALGGAALLELLSLLKKSGEAGGLLSLPLAIGFTVAALVGYISLRLLLSMLRAGKLHYFAIYCGILGALVLALAR